MSQLKFSPGCQLLICNFQFRSAFRHGQQFSSCDLQRRAMTLTFKLDPHSVKINRSNVIVRT